MSFLTSLTLQNFRCYDSAVINDLPSGLIVLHGANGAGKTNVLEAVSLLSPGRGLRGARAGDLVRQDAGPSGQNWVVSADVDTGGGVMVRLGTAYEAQKDKRIVRINGADARAQNALADYMACLWLTPQMDRLFLDGSSERRKFFDRMVFAFDPAHAGRLTRYEKAMRERAKLLGGEAPPDPAWLTGLEQQMAETGVAVAAARLDLLQRLDQAGGADQKDFPQSLLSLSGTVEELLHNAPAVEVEGLFAYQLTQSRARDAEFGGAATGPHKTDLIVRYAEKNMPAHQCSTGEQKALLTGIVLAHARLMAAERGAPPVLLLDEIAAHLDEGRRARLFDILGALGGQVWITGTDQNLISSIAQSARFFIVKDAHVLV